VIDFELDPDVEELRDRVRSFIDKNVIPSEEKDRSEHGLDDGLRRELQAAAREAGIFAPTVPHEFGGLGLDHRAQAVVLEDAGYSIPGPQALNCAAPDEGNMNLLARVGSEARVSGTCGPWRRGRLGRASR
jgi:acyl-CoA dehydrogenase